MSNLFLISEAVPQCNPRLVYCGPGCFRVRPTFRFVAGNAEVLRFVAEIVEGIEAIELEQLVREAADWGARNYDGGTWPCGVGGGSTPTLSVGLSGTGQF